MSDELQLLVVDVERLDDGEIKENAKQYAAFCDYLRLGPSRSLAKLARHYDAQVVRNGDKSAADVPTTRKRTLDSWSSKFKWQDRTRKYAEDAAAAQAEAAREQRTRVQQDELSDYEFFRQQIDDLKLKIRATNDFEKRLEMIGNLQLLIKRADDLARRATGLPHTITESKQEITGLQPITYVGVSPDDWDDD